MKRWRHWIVWLCGLVMAVQGFASVASLKLPASAMASAHGMMQMAHCHMPVQKHDGTLPKCCGDQCTDMANCFSPAASSSLHAFVIVALPLLSPPPHRLGSVAPPDPDTRLRPPAAFLG